MIIYFKGFHGECGFETKDVSAFFKEYSGLLIYLRGGKDFLIHKEDNNCYEILTALENALNKNL